LGEQAMTALFYVIGISLIFTIGAYLDRGKP
jgi:hypothetical protein